MPKPNYSYYTDTILRITINGGLCTFFKSHWQHIELLNSREHWSISLP